MSKFDDIRNEVKKLQEENIRLHNWISSQEESGDLQVQDICKDFLQVLESFEWAEATIHERGLDQSKISTSAIARMLTAKTKLLEVLESYGVKKVSFPDGVFNAAKGKIVGSVADEEKEDGKVASIVKDGFIRKDKLLRMAEVLLVKNS
ncbi:MAG: nucleotide exchange factor GrpE [Prevotella sp.]|jgi:molecular chaperone GrpE (heat shock protein)|nr:nucleotide exchange factor GrpE [Prevotella sp.]